MPNPQMPPEPPPPDAADILFSAIPRLVHFSLMTVGAVAGYVYAQQTHDENPVRCVLIGAACGVGVTLGPMLLYKAFLLLMKGVVLALVLYYVLYLPMMHRSPDLRGISDAIWKWLR